MKYEKQLRPFLIGVGAIVGVGLFGSMVAGLYSPVLGYAIPVLKHTVADILVAGGSVLAIEMGLKKV